MRPGRYENVTSHLITTGTFLVSVGGELVGEPGAAVGLEVERLVDEGAREVVLDLGDVTFVDSTALGTLVGAARRLRAGRWLAIACGDPHVVRTLELTGIDRVVRVFPTVAAAFAARDGDARAAG